MATSKLTCSTPTETKVCGSLTCAAAAIDTGVPILICLNTARKTASLDTNSPATREEGLVDVASAVPSFSPSFGEVRLVCTPALLLRSRREGIVGMVSLSCCP